MKDHVAVWEDDESAHPTGLTIGDYLYDVAGLVAADPQNAGRVVRDYIRDKHLRKPRSDKYPIFVHKWGLE